MFAAGEVLRPVTAADEAAAARHQERLAAILADAEPGRRGPGLPLLFLDGEVFLDGSQAILQAVHWADCDATPLFEELSARHGLPVKLADLTAAPAKSGCGSCGAERGRLRLVRDRRGVFEPGRAPAGPSSRPTS